MTNGLPLSAGVYAVSGNAMTLFGWILSDIRLIDWFGNGITMKANTALGSFAAGLALLIAALAPKRKIFIRLLSLLVAFIASATLFEHVTNINLGIDQLLFRDGPSLLATSAPGRMGLPAASSLLAISIALILATIGYRARFWTSVLGLASVSIASLSLVGYLFGANQLYALPKFTGIALQTASIIAALGIGVVTIIPEHGVVAALRRDDAGGVIFRRLFLPVIVISIGMGALRIWGQHLGLYDSEFGTAIRTLLEVAALLGLLWWTATDISRADRRRPRCIPGRCRPR